MFAFFLRTKRQCFLKIVERLYNHNPIHVFYILIKHPLLQSNVIVVLNTNAELLTTSTILAPRKVSILVSISFC